MKLSTLERELAIKILTEAKDATDAATRALRVQEYYALLSASSKRVEADIADEGALESSYEPEPPGALSPRLQEEEPRTTSPLMAGESKA